jgi:transposase
MRFVPVKTVEQQYVQSLHRIRQGLMQNRVALSNETRGLLAEYGCVVSKGHRGFVEGLKRLIAGESMSPDLIEPMREEAQKLLSRYLELQRQIEEYDDKLGQMATSHEPCKRLMQIRGVGPLTATAVIASVGNARAFKVNRRPTPRD